MNIAAPLYTFIAPSIKTLLETLVIAQRDGRSCLPFSFGLEQQELSQCLHYLNKHELLLSQASENDVIRAELLSLREQEFQDLLTLLLRNRADDSVAYTWLAKMVAAGCMGNEHLWRDLGLANRQDLTQLFEQFFPDLAQQNNANMRWKKFLYKQLCEAEGHYVCRSPSCEVCTSYEECFGEER